MRRLVWFSVFAIALAVPAVGLALGAGDGSDGTLSVKGGVGRVNLNFNGSAVGRIGRGTIQITDPIPGDGIGFRTGGCETTGDRDRNGVATTVCSGTGLRFRAVGGRYQIQINGTGIYLSAVGQGSTRLDGRGESDRVDTDGVYSLNDQPYKSLPDLGQTFLLVAPAGA